ncbi:acetaldehyde dehydrogenase (acetylating) [Propionispora vibrioides]|uniref:Acetaldehyde dehydrogenase (Acetylating) n=1 Tax=Propionispora vibrioides TaxID=112903 RepID=A0A1H8XT03_9FIRM|nr:acetaldehyde dehydrogenase (acetylating) [Propionispora vibrioides]SEP43025.1 acetaldehyde dehydrogenase (acetylating) [Propionispora vibrioides]
MDFDKDLQSIQEVRDKVKQAKQAAARFSEYAQETIDQIVAALCAAALDNAEQLAKLAKEETGYGKWEDKVVKNTFAARTVYESMQGLKTVGILHDDREKKIVEVGVPVGVIAALIPSTNPTSTVIFKALIALKAGNAIIFSPHPTAVRCIRETVRILQEAATRSGAPEGILNCLTLPTLEGTNALMKHKDVSLILATGGEAMVRAAYSSGTPAIGVGPGNGPAFIERSADIPQAVQQILESKTFDNGVICASEQSIVVEEIIRDAVIAEMKQRGFYFLSQAESETLGRLLLRPNKTMNPAIVGRNAQEVAVLAGLSVPADAKVLVSFQDTVSYDNPYSREKLTTVLAFYTEPTWERACLRCLELLHNEGKGHTMTIHSKNEAVIREFALKKNVSRLLVNTPAALGGIGATTNLVPALTLGCGAAGRSSTSDNVGPLNLINIRRVAYGVRPTPASPAPAVSPKADVLDIEALVRSIISQTK